MRPSLRPLVALAAVAAASAPGAAQIAPGSTLTFTGTADATDIGLGGVVLDFTNPVQAASSGNTGAFASFDRANGNGRRGTIADVRVGNGPEVIPSFVQVGGYKFTLLGLPAGRYGQDACYDSTMTYTVGATCTPYQSVQGQPQINAGLSPFYVANVAGPSGTVNSTAAFDLYGVVTAPGGATSFFTGTIASTFVGLPFQYVLSTLEQQGLQGLPFTGTFTAGRSLSDQQGDYQGQNRSNNMGAVEADLLVAQAGDPTVTPEPTTVGLLAAGLLGLVAGTRRRWRPRPTGSR